MNLENSTLLYCYRLLYAAREEIDLISKDLYRNKNALYRKELLTHIEILESVIDCKIADSN